MPTQQKVDDYGRTVFMTSDGTTDTYVVIGNDGQVFTVQKPAGTSVDAVYSTINALAPANYQT